MGSGGPASCGGDTGVDGFFGIAGPAVVESAVGNRRARDLETSRRLEIPGEEIEFVAIAVDWGCIPHIEQRAKGRKQLKAPAGAASGGERLGVEVTDLQDEDFGHFADQCGLLSKRCGQPSDERIDAQVVVIATVDEMKIAGVERAEIRACCRSNVGKRSR